MSGEAFLELVNVENLLREDVHPLEEAAGYQALMTRGGYDVARLAERVGKSVTYVYDRLKLLALAPPAQELFWDGTIMAGHAILLARLTAAEQARAIGTPPGYADGGLLRVEALLWDPNEQG